ncbi:3-carboxy-cis,cis-muconate cycloisomerase [Streptomyces sp. WAC 01529]|uniref:3-carboxy-cis,cis-muconate cycloisomerase n=1 Tax=Streptomyces sp. WAC 01529 TaxID=2203205 RepID=UPI000F6E1017|nr:3-carboxy-cis,cis-muconate cycloisomerase [Streptomyces sp. WAC 01529]AZM56784.1 3-carboxy-cis,cis-muconate cycloisomerase [Streptomyces sp. WAC 01529]
MSGLFSPGWAGSAAEEATGDPAFLQALLDAEAALTRAQAAVGLAPTGAAEAVTEAASDASRFDARALALRAREGGNPVIPLVAELTAAVPADAAPYVHRGATSQDILDTALMLLAARTLDLILPDLARAESALARLASRHRDTVMPGRTLTQHAVPTTFGLKAAGWRSLVLDARDRVAGARGTLPAQLGGAAGTLAVFGVYGRGGLCAGEGRREACGGLVAAFARELGLAEPLLPWHALRTPVADLAGALAFTAGALGKAAADVLTLSRTEIAEVSEGAGGGSSAMPHKANPVRATLIAAAARRAPALAATLYGSLVAEDERPAGAWHAEWEPLRDLLRLVGGAARDAAEMAEGLRVHPEAMREHLHLSGGLIVSERLVAELTPLLGQARAKQFLTDAARRTRAEGRTLAQILAEVLAQILAEEPALKDVGPDLGLDLGEITDPTRYTGSAGTLTDRALERR